MTDSVFTYICPDGHKTIVVQKDKGIAPLYISCVHTPRIGQPCGRKSARVLYQWSSDMVPSHELYRPKNPAGLSIANRKHVKMGGLLLRKI